MAEVKLKEETELWEPRGPCGSWGPAEEHTHSEAVEPAHLKEEPAHLKEEPAHLKEEPELCIKQEPQEFPFHMVTVKTEDDEDKSFVLHQRPTEENREETNGWDCGAEAGCSSDPLTQFHSDSEEEEHTDSSEDTDHSEDYSQEQAPAKRSYAMIPPDARVKDKTPHSCSECGKSFKWKSHLLKHMLKHTGERPHKCSVCEKGFTEKESLVHHLRTKHHKCTVCEVCFSDNMSLKEHVKKHIEDGTLDPSILKAFFFSDHRPHCCLECGNKFRFKSQLKTHKFTHSLEKTHKCPECGKSFKRKSQLKDHRFSHSGEMPHKCSECGKKFQRKSDVNRHMLSHTGEKPFSCSACGKKFPHKFLLNKHMLKHTGERPHKCSLCEKSYTEKSILTKHLRTKHHMHPSQEQNTTLNTSPLSFIFWIIPVQQ